LIVVIRPALEAAAVIFVPTPLKNIVRIGFRGGARADVISGMV
jgi:hypothetical protein